MRNLLIKYAGLLSVSLLAAFVLLGLLELVLRVLGVAEGPPAYDPLAGFSARIPIFEPYTREDGEPGYQVSRARLLEGDGTVPPERQFLAEKPPGGFRAFVLGGSSAAGFPYPPQHAFAAALERRLEASFPEMPIEVVNAALPGYASRRILIIAREITAYEPDFVVVYSGHNEWAERQFHSRFVEMDPWLFRLREIVLTTRISKLLSSLTLGAPSEEESRDEAVAVMGEQGQMFRVLGKRSTGEAYATPEELAERDRHYRTNVEEMVRAAKSVGAEVALVTLTQNFADWGPGASEHAENLPKADERRWYALMDEGYDAAGKGDGKSAIASWMQAVEIDGVFAQLHYRIAECYRELGEFDMAREHYRRASDLDRVPHGAPTYYNEILRELAAREEVLLVDADAALRAASRDGLMGSEFFNEFVHPNLRAQQLIGAAIAAELRAASVPRPAEEWAGPAYADPGTADLYAADPDLEVRELVSWRAVCMVSRRPRCVEELTRRLGARGIHYPKRAWHP